MCCVELRQWLGVEDIITSCTTVNDLVKPCVNLG